MKAYFGAKGLTAILEDSDIEKNHFECRIEQYSRPRLIVDISSSVYKKFPDEKNGFHMEYTPSLFSSDNILKSREISVKISEDNWKKFLSQDSGKYFSSFSRGDVFTMQYFSARRTIPENFVPIIKMADLDRIEKNKPLKYHYDHEDDFISKLLNI